MNYALMHNRSMLRAIRNEQGLTQEQLSEKSGVEQTTISGLETGRIKRPAWEIVAKLANALGVAPEKLFPINTENGNAA
jgi:transcriptional regulator with XRE-family HTH domain